MNEQCAVSSPKPILAGLTGLILLTGCAWFPEASPPSEMTALPKLHNTLATLRASGLVNGQWPKVDWWTIFASQQLNGLVTTALSDNPDLKSVAARLRQAQAYVDVQAADLYPTVQANAAFSAQRYSANSTQVKFAGEQFRQLLINPLVLRYHLDLWGRDRAALESAVGFALAKQAELSDARLLLSAAVTEAYFSLSATSKKLADYQLVEAGREQMLRLENIRWANGLTNDVSKQNAQINLASAKQQVHVLRAQLDLYRNRLAALAGKHPDWGKTIVVEAGVLPSQLTLPNELPLSLLAQRPDVLAARLLVEAAAQDIKVVTTAFYPDVNLYSFAGLHSVNITDVLLQGSSLAYAVGPSIEFPIFEGGRLRAQLKHREAAYDEAVERYNSLLLKAAQEVADALTKWRDVNDRIQEQRSIVGTAQKTENLLEVRYQLGLDDQRDWLTARISSETQNVILAELEEKLFITTSQVMTALGGGYIKPKPGK